FRHAHHLAADCRWRNLARRSRRPRPRTIDTPYLTAENAETAETTLTKENSASSAHAAVKRDPAMELPGSRRRRGAARVRRGGPRIRRSPPPDRGRSRRGAAGLS